MKVVFGPRARRDMPWFRKYYNVVFPEGRQKASVRIRICVETLKANPLVGHPVDGTNLRQFVISRTPFSLVCRIDADEILVIRVRDQRSGADDELR